MVGGSLFLCLGEGCLASLSLFSYVTPRVIFIKLGLWLTKRIDEIKYGSESFEKLVTLSLRPTVISIWEAVQ